MHTLVSENRKAMKKSIILFLTVSLLSIAISAVIISFSEKTTRNTDDGNDRKENVEKSVTEEDAMSMMERKITDRVRARERKIRNMMLAVIALTVVVSSIIIDKTGTERRRTEIRNKRLMRSIELLEKEKEMLSSMRKDGELNEEMRGMLEERLRVLNGFITAYVSGND